ADNYSYMLPTMDGTNFQLGWASDVADQDMVFTNNYIVGGYVNRDKMWQSMRVSGNTFYTNNSLPLQDLEPRGGFSTSSYNWNNNSYYGGSSNPFIYNGQSMSLSGWRSATGLDQNSTFTSGRPTGVRVFVRPNQYEAGRANVTIYNWARQSTVDVSMSGILNVGDRYEVRDAANYWGVPVVNGTYNGSPLHLPMSGLGVAVPYGWPAAPATGPDFNAFIVLRTSGSSTPAATSTSTPVSSPSP